MRGERGGLLELEERGRGTRFGVGVVFFFYIYFF